MIALIDEQLPPDLAHWIKSKGWETFHVRDLGLQRAPDTDVWNKCLELGAVLFTKDEDFVDTWLRRQPRVSLVWIRIGNCTNPALFNWLEPLWPELTRRLEAGEQFIELRR